MDRERIGGNRPPAQGVHKLVIRLSLGAILWTVLAIWLLFRHSYYDIMVFGVVTFLVGMAVAIPSVLARFAKRRAGAGDDTDQTFGEWREREFETGSGPMKAGDAALLILLIPMMVAVMVTALGVLEYLTAAGVLT